MNQSQQNDIPIQPVEQPILCSPYDEPDMHWIYDTSTGEAVKNPGRREAGYWYKTKRTGSAQLSLFQEEERDDLPLVNALRADVKRWRETNYRNATVVTRELLRHWARDDLLRRLFFCQREAVETIIYLVEIRQGGKRLGFNPTFTDDDLGKLVDTPNEPNLADLIRFGCKMATGSGKTVVMAMLIAWAFCNRGKVPSDERFPAAALVVCPNLTIKKRLQVLRSEDMDNYYDAFELIPTKLRPLLNSGKVLVTNWHQFAPESEHSDGGQTYAVVNKGEETPDAFAKRVLGELYDRAPIMVLNDEGHHAYRPAPTTERLSADIREERRGATIWVSGLDKFNQSCGVKFCVDLSATPFYIQGSGHDEGSPFPWLVSDFGLVDAIESGITKIPRLPVSDTTGRPEPRYFRLWQSITDEILPADRLPGGKPKPNAVYREAEDALNTLAGQWKERFDYIQEATDEQDKTPPVLIIVCDNTNIAEYFYQMISGEREEDVIDENGRVQTKIVYEDGAIFPDLLGNSEGVTRTLRIDSKVLAAAESGDPNKNRSQAAEELRQIVATIGKKGKPGAPIRCVVSVAMLNEGWDANNVTHILGLRAFSSQLLCEQVVGRGLRRMNYTPDPETGRLTEEYADVYGIPFSVIPFRGRPRNRPEPDDKPINHVRAIPGREHYEIRFPVVEGYAFALRQNEIKADIAAMDTLRLEPEHTPTAVFVKAAAGYQIGEISSLRPGELIEHNRNEYYATTHIQTIKFEITRQIVCKLVGDKWNAPDPESHPNLRLISRHRLFPQVFSLVDNYIETKVDFRDCHPCELGLQKYVELIVSRLMAAILPDETQGEVPLLPILNRYKPVGTSAAVDFFTTRSCHGTQRSQVNLVVLDTQRWERSACFYLESSDVVKYYVRNDHLGLSIPYQHREVTHSYEPDFIVRLKNGVNVLLETKGYKRQQESLKSEAAKRWVAAVNNWNRERLGEPEQQGRWAFHVCEDPQRLTQELNSLLSSES